MDNLLPFRRGGTLLDGVAGFTLNDTVMKQLEGRIFWVPDTIHGTGRRVGLRAVKNDTGGDITVAHKFGEFSVADALDWGGRIGQFPCNTAGAVVRAIDDAYPANMVIKQYDLFYVVEYGPVYVLTGAAVNSLAAGGAVCSDNAGVIANKATAAAGEYVVGTLDKATYAAATDTLVFVGEPVLPPASG